MNRHTMQNRRTEIDEKKNILTVVLSSSSFMWIWIDADVLFERVIGNRKFILKIGMFQFSIRLVRVCVCVCVYYQFQNHQYAPQFFFYLLTWHCQCYKFESLQNMLSKIENCMRNMEFFRFIQPDIVSFYSKFE